MTDHIVFALADELTALFPAYRFLVTSYRQEPASINIGQRIDKHIFLPAGNINVDSETGSLRLRVDKLTGVTNDKLESRYDLSDPECVDKLIEQFRKDTVNHVDVNGLDKWAQPGMRTGVGRV